jgi:MoaA/NifB/PqqE/SkfB family radical SAM enzyme
VSLDGATAATNDAIRDGGRFDAIVANVRGAVRLRREQALDLRIGVSTVVLRQNVTELDALVDLCADLGVDWLKLEEGVPASEFAATSLLRLDPAGRDAREPVERALERARAAGLVAVDHTFDRGHLWRCALGPEETRFLADDEHANRSVIHPCRVPWEVACIEPNGDVRLGDFFGPVLGNVADASLAELWNQPPARSERARARAARICGAGPVVCVPTSAPRAR